MIFWIVLLFTVFSGLLLIILISEFISLLIAKYKQRKDKHD